MEVNDNDQSALLVSCLSQELRSPAVRLGKPKESRMRVKKRIRKGVKKGVKRVKSAPPEAYVAGMGVLVGGTAVLLLATTKSGRELLIRAAQLALPAETDEEEPQESDESDVQEEVRKEPAEDADVEEEAADVEEEPADVEEEPADVEEEPADVEEEPEDVEEEPADVEEEPEDVEEEPEEDTNAEDASEVTDLKPRIQRPRRPRKAHAPRKATNA
jgi:hypothetical protein